MSGSAHNKETLYQVRFMSEVHLFKACSRKKYLSIAKKAPIPPIAASTNAGMVQHAPVSTPTLSLTGMITAGHARKGVIYAAVTSVL